MNMQINEDKYKAALRNIKAEAERAANAARLCADIAEEALNNSEAYMTYFITALTNDNARVIVSESRTTEKAIADIIAAIYEAQGYYVIRYNES